MKKLAALMVAVALLSGSPLALAGEKAAGEKVSMTGWITDAACGAANANTEGKACTIACAKKGAKLVLFSDDKLWPLDDQELALEHVGHEVRVTGVLTEGGAIQVDSIEPTREKRA